MAKLSGERPGEATAPRTRKDEVVQRGEEAKLRRELCFIGGGRGEKGGSSLS